MAKESFGTLAVRWLACVAKCKEADRAADQANRIKNEAFVLLELVVADLDDRVGLNVIVKTCAVGDRVVVVLYRGEACRAKILDTAPEEPVD